MLHNTMGKIFFILSISIFFMCAIFIYYMFGYSKIYPNISIEGINISGLTCEEATNKVCTELDLSNKTFIDFNTQNQKKRINFIEIDLKFLAKDNIKELYDYGRKGSFFTRFKYLFSLITTPVNKRLQTSYNEDFLKNILIEIKNNIDIQSKNAEIHFQDDKIVHANHIQGKNLNINTTLKKFKNQNILKSTTLQLDIDILEPKVKFDDIKTILHPISTFQTKILSTNPNRTHNIQIALNKINNVIIMPSEIFSINDALGSRTYKNGYKDAPIIVNSKMIQGIGGGICQVSSTLYCSAILAELEILERTPHSTYLGYIKPGLDATIVENLLDLKFKNNQKTPILIKSEMKKNTVKIEIFGNQLPLKKQITTKIVNEIPIKSTEFIHVNNKLADNEIVRHGKKGLEVQVFLEIYSSSNILLEKILINKSLYKPLSPIIKLYKSSN